MPGRAAGIATAPGVRSHVHDTIQVRFMKELDDKELECLRYIADNQPGIVSPCALHVLEHLTYLGLIEQHTSMWLPLEMKHINYRITSLGRAILLRH